MPTTLAATHPPHPAELQAQAATDDQLIAMWLHGKGKRTQESYSADVRRLLTHTPKALATLTLGDLQAFVDTLHALSPGSQRRVTSSIKSLFTFAHKLGYLRFNVAAVLIAPKSKDTLAE